MVNGVHFTPHQHTLALVQRRSIKVQHIGANVRRIAGRQFVTCWVARPRYTVTRGVHQRKLYCHLPCQCAGALRVCEYLGGAHDVELGGVRERVLLLQRFAQNRLQQ